jgi:hypothetical protein
MKNEIWLFILSYISSYHKLNTSGNLPIISLTVIQVKFLPEKKFPRRKLFSHLFFSSKSLSYNNLEPFS